MRQWVTEIKAIDPVDGELKTYAGPNVPALNLVIAEQYCQDNGLGYCRIIGELVAEIPCKPGTFDPDWDNQVNYDNLN